MRHFTRTEAAAHLGAIVEKRTIQGPEALADIPTGTRGRVVRIERYRRDEYDLVVQWDLPAVRICGRSQPLRDWLIRREWECHIHVVALSPPPKHELSRTSGAARGSARRTTSGGPVRLRRPLQ